MRKNLALAIALVMGCCTSSISTAATMYFDFGDSATAAGGNYNLVYSAVTSTVPNAIDSLGNPTGIQLVSSGFHEFGGNPNGTLAPSAPADIFVSDATRDSVYGHTTNWGNATPRLTGTVSITGLDGSGATAYDFAFFASRTGVTDNRETLYAVAGLNNDSAALNASNNTSNLATVSGITPTAAGEITVTVTKGPNNNNGNGFFYLGAMQVVSSRVIPEPATFGMLVIAGLLWGVLRRR